MPLTTARNGSLTRRAVCGQGTIKRGDYIRPVKRQQMNEPTPEAGIYEQRRRNAAAALGKCPEDQVFPHVARTITAQLLSNLNELGVTRTRYLRLGRGLQYCNHLLEHQAGHTGLVSLLEPFAANLCRYTRIASCLLALIIQVQFAASSSKHG
ncbi:hypothetical protein F4679DRAFT_408571 [Xylaria curta]|nr:hypothetical protein F4679DRAFT_408571 [Xylaria curta]